MLLNKLNRTVLNRLIVLKRNASDNIPSPRGLPIIGTTLSFLLSGSSSKLHLYIDRNHKKLGPIFRDKIGPVSAIFVSDPDLIRSIFRQEGRHPIHILPEPWIVYNKKYGRTRGLFFMDGEEWLYYRRLMNKLLLKNDINVIEKCCAIVAQDLVKQWQIKNNSITLEYDLYVWSVKTLLSLLIGPENYLKALHIYEDLLFRYANTVKLIFETTSKLLLLPAELACKFQIKSWRNFEKCVNESLSLSNELVERLLSDFPNSGLLKSLQEEGINGSVLIRIVSDLILAAGDTTAYTMEWTLYLLAKHQNEQSLLRERIDKVNNTGQYLKNFIRETLRLYPVAPFLTRIFPNEINIGNYKVPSGSLVLVSLYTSGRDSKFFDRPNDFVPDRWLRESNNNLKSMQLASVPFAIGARSCIGKKIAETQLQITLKEIVKNFNVELLNEDEIDIVLKLITVPSRPIRIKLRKI